MSELTNKLWSDDKSSALTNQAARRIEELEIDKVILLGVRDKLKNRINELTEFYDSINNIMNK